MSTTSVLRSCLRSESVVGQARNGESCPANVVFPSRERRRIKSPKSSNKPSFKQILRSVSLRNVRNLIDKAELAASLARFCPHSRRELYKIEQRARAQLQAIAGLSFGTAAAAD